VTHYRRSWWVVLSVAAMIVVGAGLLALIGLLVIAPNFFDDVRYYGLAPLDRTGTVLLSLAFAVFVTSIWWLRHPREARGRGFDAHGPLGGSTTADASCSRTTSTA
jgi:hypothetical protein